MVKFLKELLSELAPPEDTPATFEFRRTGKNEGQVIVTRDSKQHVVTIIGLSAEEKAEVEELKRKMRDPTL